MRKMMKRRRERKIIIFRAMYCAVSTRLSPHSLLNSNLLTLPSLLFTNKDVAQHIGIYKLYSKHNNIKKRQQGAAQ